MKCFCSVAGQCPCAPHFRSVSASSLCSEVLGPAAVRLWEAAGRGAQAGTLNPCPLSTLDRGTLLSRTVGTAAYGKVPGGTPRHTCGSFSRGAMGVQTESLGCVPALGLDPGATVGRRYQARSSVAQPRPQPTAPTRPRRLGTTWPHTWGLPLGLGCSCPSTIWLQEGRDLAEVTKLVSGRVGAETHPLPQAWGLLQHPGHLSAV